MPAFPDDWDGGTNFSDWEKQVLQYAKATQNLACLSCSSSRLSNNGVGGNANEGGFQLIQVKCAECGSKIRLKQLLEALDDKEPFNIYSDVLENATLTLNKQNKRESSTKPSLSKQTTLNFPSSEPPSSKRVRFSPGSAVLESGLDPETILKLRAENEQLRSMNHELLEQLREMRHLLQNLTAKVDLLQATKPRPSKKGIETTSNKLKQASLAPDQMSYASVAASTPNNC